MHTALNIVIEPFQNGSVLQWDLMRSDHPENCDVMYEIIFFDNGKVLRTLVSETQVSKENLIQAGFPYCRSTMVSVAPHVSAHNVIGNLTKNTTYLAIPGKKISRHSACMYQTVDKFIADFSGPNIVKSIPRFIYKSAKSTELQVIYNWDPVPPGVRYSLPYN